jgi:hypothetical protein
MSYVLVVTMLLLCLSVVLLLVSNMQAAICLAYSSRSLPSLSRNVMTHLKVYVGNGPLSKLHF